MSLQPTGLGLTKAHSTSKSAKWCRRCVVKHFLSSEITTAQLQDLFNLGPGARLGSIITRKFQIGNFRSSTKGSLLVVITEQGTLKCQVDIFPLLYVISFKPSELGVNPIFEFDQSAAEWLGLVEI